MKASLVFLLLAVAASVTHGCRCRDDGCPAPYDRLDETRCILVDPFVARTYADSLAYCESHGGNLVFYDTCNDQNLVNDYLHTEEGLLSKNYWLAATDEATEGSYIWEHNKQPVPSGNPFWHVGEPSTSTTNNCAVMGYQYSHRWIDVSCASKYMVICLRDG